jgi:hypothetical protein
MLPFSRTDSNPLCAGCISSFLTLPHPGAGDDLVTSESSERMMMTSRNAYRWTIEHANPACAPVRDILAAGVFSVRATSPAACPSRDVAARGGIVLALDRMTPRQRTNRQAALVSHDARSRNCAGRSAFRRLRPPLPFQKESVAVSRLHIYKI